MRVPEDDRTHPGYRVGIDGYNLAIPRGTGVATYARVLSHCLQELGHKIDLVYGLGIGENAAPTLRTVEFFDQLQTPRSGRLPKYPSVSWAMQMLHAYRGMTAFEIPVTDHVIATQMTGQLAAFDRILNVTDLFAIAARLFRNFGTFMSIRVPDPPVVMHWTYPVPITLQGAVNIYTIHDLVPLRLPYTTLDHKPTHFRLLTECLRRGAHIATVSETSRDDILKFFPSLSPDRVTNTYQAVVSPSDLPSMAEVEQMVRGGFGLQPGGYFLFFGSIEPKKNVGRLLEAYLTSDLSLPLVLIGARAWKSEDELRLLEHRPKDEGRVRQVEYVSRDVLTTLIRGARAVVFPSLYEGFGLPLLEAMSLGTPVLTSREGSLPEVAGDAALFVDAYDVRDIAAGLTRLARNDGLCAELRTRGLVRAREFDMAHYRMRVASLYDRLVPEGG